MQVMKIKYGEPFRIPRRLGDLFKDVVRIDGVDYVRGAGFTVRDYYALSNLNKILIRLGLVLLPMVTCTICGRDVDCEECEYTDVCRKDVNLCLCRECTYSENVVDKYRLSVRKRVFKG